jgi:preprotein translocase subunit SecA
MIRKIAEMKTGEGKTLLQLFEVRTKANAQRQIDNSLWSR